MKPFVEFYDQNEVMPVVQKQTKGDIFIKKRTLLYGQLGVPISFLDNKKILEFGPGGGFNTEPIFQAKPLAFHFVEGSKFGVQLLKKRIKNYQKKINIEIFENEFMNFKSKNMYDLVIAESCVPGQINHMESIRIVSQPCAF